MGDIVDLQGKPMHLEDNMEFVADCCRFQEKILSEANMKLKWRFADSVWEKLGDNTALLEAVEDEKIRRIRNGQQKRERAQMLVTRAPDVLDSIMSDPAASPRFRVDAAKTLDAFAANGPQAAPASDRFSIVINLGSDGSDHIERFNKSIEVNVDDVDPNDTNNTDPGNDDIVDREVQRLLTAVTTTNKPGSDGGGNAL